MSERGSAQSADAQASPLLPVALVSTDADGTTRRSPSVPFEYRLHRPIPEEIELCAQCLQAVVFYRGKAGAVLGLPYCPKCGAEAPGIAFARKSEDGR